MNKYIDADALKSGIINTPTKALDEFGFWSNDMLTVVANRQNEIIDMIDKMPAADVEPVRKWISCSERLPEDGKKVLVYWERLDRKTNTVYGFIDILYRTSERGWYCDGRGELNWNAIAWQPLPEPPKMDGGNGS